MRVNFCSSRGRVRRTSRRRTSQSREALWGGRANQSNRMFQKHLESCGMFQKLPCASRFVHAGRHSLGRGCFHGGRACINKIEGVREISSTVHVQGHLAHKKTPIPLGPPWDPRNRPTVGSQGGAFSYVRCPCTRTCGGWRRQGGASRLLQGYVAHKKTFNPLGPPETQGIGQR